MPDDGVIIFLDDDPFRAALAYQRMPKEVSRKVIWCKTAQEVISILEDEEYIKRLETIHLDHDLEGVYQDPCEKNCGMEVVRFIETLDPKVLKHVRFNVHSWNNHQAIKMIQRLKKLGLRVEYNPFGLKKEALL